MIQIIGLTSSLSWTHMPNCCGWLERTIEWEFQSEEIEDQLGFGLGPFSKARIIFRVIYVLYLFSHPIFVSFSFHPVCNSFLFSLFVFLTVSLSLTMSVWCGSKGQRSICQAAGLSGIWSLYEEAPEERVKGAGVEAGNKGLPTGWGEERSSVLVLTLLV
jgi:hypothetical protein